MDRRVFKCWIKSIANPITVMDPTNVKNSPILCWSLDKASNPAYNMVSTQTKARPKTVSFFIKAGFIKISRTKVTPFKLQNHEESTDKLPVRRKRLFDNSLFV